MSTSPTTRTLAGQSEIPDSFASLMTNDGIELREGYAEVGDDTTLHYVEAGEGPLVLLLHGFPEFWFGWRRQIAPLALRAFESSHRTHAATTCRPGRQESRSTPSIGSRPTFAA